MHKYFHGFTGLGVAASIALFASASLPANAQDKVEFKNTDLGNGIYMLVGQGGNIGFSVGEDGVFMIDDQFAHLTPGILKEIRKISDKPIRYVLNTHYHGDHTGGNENLAKQNAVIMAHDNVRARLAEGKKPANGEPTPTASLPVITYSETASVHLNGQKIMAVHVPNAHTDGDTVVHFTESNIIHAGDTFFSGRYPYIDLDAGGSVDGAIATLEMIAQKSDDATKIIPGHGPLSTKADVLATVKILRSARNAVEELVAAGKTEAEVLAANPLAPWNDTMSWQFISGERMTKTLYQDLTAE